MGVAAQTQAACSPARALPGGPDAEPGGRCRLRQIADVDTEPPGGSLPRAARPAPAPGPPARRDAFPAARSRSQTQYNRPHISNHLAGKTESPESTPHPSNGKQLRFHFPAQGWVDGSDERLLLRCLPSTQSLPQGPSKHGDAASATMTGKQGSRAVAASSPLLVVDGRSWAATAGLPRPGPRKAAAGRGGQSLSAVSLRLCG